MFAENIIQMAEVSVYLFFRFLYDGLMCVEFNQDFY